MPSHRFDQRKHGDRTQTRSGGRYDYRHARARRDAAQRHAPTDPCARCGHILGPMSSALHYDHDEHGGYLGFSHGAKPCPACGKRCNLSAGAVKGNQLQGNQRGPLNLRRCEHCQSRFQPHNVRQRHCTQACRDATTQQRIPLTPRPCTECAVVFTPNVAIRLTCSTQCGKTRSARLNREDPTWPTRAQAYQQRARAARTRTW